MPKLDSNLETNVETKATGEGSGPLEEFTPTQAGRALRFAASSGDVQALQNILQSNAINSFAYTDYELALEEAVELGHLGTTQILINNKVILSQITHDDVFWLLYWSSYFGHPSIVDYLIHQPIAENMTVEELEKIRDGVIKKLDQNLRADIDPDEKNEKIQAYRSITSVLAEHTASLEQVGAREMVHFVEPKTMAALKALLETPAQDLQGQSVEELAEGNEPSPAPIVPKLKLKDYEELFNPYADADKIMLAIKKRISSADGKRDS